MRTSCDGGLETEKRVILSANSKLKGDRIGLKSDKI